MRFERMKPIDDNETPDDTAEEIDEVVEDIEDDFDIESEIKRRRRSRGTTKNKGRQNGSIVSFIVWIAFTIVWLFFFAGGYELFENFAVISVALLIIGALNAIAWIPPHEGWKARISALSGVAWIAFLILWVVFYATGYGLYENIGIGLASLLFVGLINAMIHIPGRGDEGSARVSAFGGITWLIFLVLWLPFANNFSATVFAITFYQNLAIILLSFLVMTLIVVAPWFGKMKVEINAAISVGGRPQGTIGLLWGWLAVLVYWLWFQADAYTANKNIAIVLLSFAVFCVIIMAVWIPWARKRGEGPESWFSIGLAFVWVILLTSWYWFFADQFNDYQNFAVFLVSLLVMVGIGGLSQWRRIRDFEAMDWED